MRYIDLKLDRPRRLGYIWRDASELSRRLGGASIQDMLQKLAEMDPLALNTFLLVGLKNFDRSLTFEQTEEIVQKWLDGDNRITDLLGFVVEALTLARILPSRKEEGDQAQPDPPLGST